MSRKIESNLLHDIKSMMGIFDHIHSIGKKVHVWKRQSLPNLKTFHDISYDSWCNIRSFLADDYKIDASASFQWIQNDKDIKDRLIECIHIESGYTIYFTDYDNKVELIFDHESIPKVKELLVEKLFNLKEPRSNDEIGLLTKIHGSLDVNFFKFRQYEHNIIPYLGDEIQSFYERTVKQIQDETKSGLFLLYGEPGTGKTSFLKRIISKVNNQAIFVTPSMAEHLASPALIGLLSDYSGSILIIEDAEKILMKREGDNSNAVSTILNLSDGFTADFLNLNIICTFNTEITEIDPALLRKGRLKGMQEFKKLEEESISTIIKKFNLSINNMEPMTLAELWNNGDEVGKFQEKKVGFLKV